MNEIILVTKESKKQISGGQFTQWLRESNQQGKLYIKNGVLRVSSTPAQHQQLAFVSASVLKPMLLDRFSIDTPTAFIIAGKISAELGGIPAKEIKAVTVTPATTVTPAPTVTPATTVDIIQCVEKALLVLDFSSTKVTKKEIVDAVYQARQFLKQARG